MSVWRGPAPAKLNLFLRVVGRRPDGYHRLVTLFQTIRFADIVEVELAGDGEIILESEGIDVGVPPERNLAWRAARDFLTAARERRGCRIRLRKEIPHGTGLGGGSSDAAAVLRGLNRLAGTPLDMAALAGVGRSLGADVPFLLTGGTALGRGIGDEIEPVPELTGGAIALLLPAVSLSTARVYGAGFFSLTENDLETTIPLSAGDLLSMASRLGNDLADPARRLAPQLGAACRDIVALSPLVGGMTGSGSAHFAWFAGREEAEHAARALSVHGRTLVTEPLTREEFDASCSLS